MQIILIPDETPLVGKNGRSLRCTVILSDKDALTGEEYAWKTEGCLVSRLKTGELKFMTPRTNYGRASRTLNYASDALATKIEAAIANHPLAAFIGKNGPEGVVGAWLPDDIEVGEMTL